MFLKAPKVRKEQGRVVLDVKRVWEEHHGLGLGKKSRSQYKIGGETRATGGKGSAWGDVFEKDRSRQ